VPDVRIFDDARELSRQAALCGAESIRSAISERHCAFIVLATGSSQIQMLEYLVQMPDIDWSVVTAFHLDEYIGLSRVHKASFRRYLREHFVQPLNGKPTLHEIDGEGDPEKETQRLNQLIINHEIDVVFAGIGENCHLAFNDPPADFCTKNPYLVVSLDELCRQQQVDGEWFSDLSEVPLNAISMSISQIMKAKRVIALANGKRKANAVYHALNGDISSDYPASILRQHDNAIWFLDSDATMQLK